MFVGMCTCTSVNTVLYIRRCPAGMLPGQVCFETQVEMCLLSYVRAGPGLAAGLNGCAYVCCRENPWGWLKLTLVLPLDGAHTLTCALMLLNTDLHGHVSEGLASGSQKTRDLKALGGQAPPNLTSLCFPPLEHWEAHDLWGLHRKPGRPQ